MLAAKDILHILTNTVGINRTWCINIYCRKDSEWLSISLIERNIILTYPVLSLHFVLWLWGVKDTIQKGMRQRRRKRKGQSCFRKSGRHFNALKKTSQTPWSELSCSDNKWYLANTYWTQSVFETGRSGKMWEEGVQVGIFVLGEWTTKEQARRLILQTIRPLAQCPRWAFFFF